MLYLLIHKGESGGAEGMFFLLTLWEEPGLLLMFSLLTVDSRQQTVEASQLRAEDTELRANEGRELTVLLPTRCPHVVYYAMLRSALLRHLLSA